MNKDKHATALAAMTDLVHSVLDGDEMGRFQKASSLCALAQKLALHGIPQRVGEVKRMQGIGIPRFVGDGGLLYDGPDMGEIANLQGDGAAAYYPNPHTGPNDFQRQILMAIAPILATQKRSQESSELNSLITARDALKTAGGSEEQIEKLNTRINSLIEAVTALPKEKENAEHADVVPTELLRGHSPGIVGQAGDESDCVRPIPPGEGGGDGAAQGSGEAASGGAMLEPQRVPPFRSRLDEGTDAGAERADLEGAEALGQAPEAEPGAGERGEVRGREDAGDDGAGARSNRPGHERYRGLQVGLDGVERAVFDQEE